MKLSFTEAHAGTCLDFLENIVAGNFWYEGRQFDPPELQRAKAKVILEALQTAELDIQSLPTDHCGAGSKWEAQANLMLLRLDVETKFHEAITKAPQPEPKACETETRMDNPAESDNETVLTSEDKVNAAKALVRSGLY